jgi:hypothetical protein
VLSVFEKHWVVIYRNVYKPASEMAFALSNVRSSPVRELALAGKGGLIALPHEASAVGMPFFTGDGQFVLFDCADAAGASERCLVDVHGDLPDVVPASSIELRLPGDARVGGIAQTPRSSPSGRYLWLGDDASLDVVDLAKVPAQRTRLVEDEELLGAHLPKGGAILLGERRLAWLTAAAGDHGPELYLLERGPDGFGAPTQVAFDTDTFGAIRSFLSISERRLFFRTERQGCVVFDVTTGEVEALPFSFRGASPDRRYVALSGPDALAPNPPPDQDFLAFYPLLDAGLVSAELIRIPHVNSFQRDVVRWSGASSRAALVPGPNGTLTYVDLLARAGFDLDTSEQLANEFSPDGNWLLRRAYDSERTLLLDLASKGAKTYELVAPDEAHHVVTFSPDSTQLAIMADAPGGRRQLTLRSLAGGEQRSIDPGEVSPEGFSWLWPDLLLIEGSGNYTKYVMSLEPGSQPRAFLEHSRPSYENEDNLWRRQP